MATGTLGTSARDYHTRQTHYLSLQISGAVGGNFASNTATIKMGTVPAGAVILRAHQGTSVVFNNGTTNTLSIGTAASGAQLFASAAAGMATLGRTDITVIGAASGPMAADQDIWVTNTSTGTASTTGQSTIDVEYIIP